MLVLSRKKNEKIVIGGHDCKITLVVVEIRGDKVRLGVEAPKDIPVHRGEVEEAIRKSGGVRIVRTHEETLAAKAAAAASGDASEV